MDSAELYTSGILNENEDVFEFIKGKMLNVGSGFLVVTYKQLLFVTKPNILGTGLMLKKEIHLMDMSSVSITRSGAIPWIQIQTTYAGTSLFRCKDLKEFRTKLIAHKKRFADVYQPDNKGDTPANILKKRLARGEIDLEEFHQKIQRT